MKPTINKSEVMKRAWTIYKNCRRMFPTFSSALTQAWVVEKANLAKAIKDAEIEANTFERTSVETSGRFDMSHLADTLINYYASNSYKGD